MVGFVLVVLASLKILKTNIAPENRPSQKESSLPTIREGKPNLLIGFGLKKQPRKSVLSGMWIFVIEID